MRNALSFEQYSCSRNALSNVQRNNPSVLCPCRVLQFVSQEYASFFKISFIVVVRLKFLRFAQCTRLKYFSLCRYLVQRSNKFDSGSCSRWKIRTHNIGRFFSKWFCSSFQRNNQQLSLNPFASFDEWLI